MSECPQQVDFSIGLATTQQQASFRSGGWKVGWREEGERYSNFSVVHNSLNSNVSSLLPYSAGHTDQCCYSLRRGYTEV